MIISRLQRRRMRHGRHLGHRSEGAFGGAPPPFFGGRECDSLGNLSDRAQSWLGNEMEDSGPRFSRVSSLCLIEPMDFWTLLALALAVLWMQANVIFCAGLHAMRAEARVRWEAFLRLEKCLVERRAEVAGAVAAEFTEWAAVFEKTIFPENGPAVLGFFEHRTRWGAMEHGPGFPVLELRCRQAALRYAEAAALYNGRISSFLGWPLSRWMGFAPVQLPPRQTSSG